MQFLRCLSASLAGIELPLPEKIANALIDVLLAPNSQQRSLMFAAALRQSPALLIWLLDRCRIKKLSFSKPTLRELARGFEKDLLRSLSDSLVCTGESEDGGRQLSDKNVQAITVAAIATVDALEVSRRAVGWLQTRHVTEEKNGVDKAPGQLQIATAVDENDSSIAEIAYFLSLIHNVEAYCADAESNTRAKEISATSVIKIVEPYLGTLDSKEAQLAAEAVAHGWADWRQNQLPAENQYSDLQQAWIKEAPASARLLLLTQSLSRLTLLESEFEVALEEAKLKAMYKLAAGAGHEINNPLGSIAGRAQLLLRDENDPERRRTLAKINSQAFRAHEMIADMMLFARPPLPQFDQIAPGTLIQSLIDEMHEITEQQEAEIVSHVATDIVTMRVDPSQIRVALRAMCTNALEATGIGGKVEINVSNGPIDKAPQKSSAPVQTVQITVCDNGPGFSEEERQHLFDPFYSGREAGRGLGFGLSKCWRIVRNHGGRINVQSKPGRGATFEITLPVD